MGKVWDMAIYEYKDYLNFFDVADYLADNKIHEFDLGNECDFGELGIFLQDFVLQGKLNPYFYADVYADCKVYKLDNNTYTLHSESQMVNFNGFFQINIKMFNELILSKELGVKQFVPYTKKNDSKLGYRLNEATYHIYTLDMRFDKAEISSIFQPSMQLDPPNKEMHPRSANTASKIIGALAIEMLGMDLSKPYSDDTNGKIKKSLDAMGVNVSTDTIAYWLKLAFDNTK